jgi:hypothetical protein
MQGDGPAMSPPDTQTRVLDALHLVLHGPRASARRRFELVHPAVPPVGFENEVWVAEQVLRAAVSAAFAELRPEALERISQAVATALAPWPPRFRELGGGTHWRPE